MVVVVVKWVFWYLDGAVVGVMWIGVCKKWRVGDMSVGIGGLEGRRARGVQVDTYSR